LTASISADSGRFRLSTDDLPAADRLPVWREAFGRAIAKVDFEPAGDGPFRQAVRLRSFAGLKLMFGETNGLIAGRTRELLADGDDDLSFTTNLSGASLAVRGGREVAIGAGEAVLKTTAEISAMHWPAPARFVAFRIPRRTLAGLVAAPEDALMRPIDRNAGALRLLVDYVVASEEQAFAMPRLSRLFATHIHDLLALALGASRDGAEIARGRGLKAARLRAIKADILANLGGERELSLDALARRHNISPAYVRKLFESEHTSFTQFVLDQRLARAYRLLGDPRLADRPIGAIALEAGFNDLSYFNRAFRRRYGASPSDVRAAGRLEE
jgi:AraC-like DNA-binding protein